MLGRIQAFKDGASKYVPPKAIRCRGLRGHPPAENFEIEVLVYGFSRILRPSQRVIMSHLFFNLGGSTEPPRSAPGNERKGEDSTLGERYMDC